MRITIKNKLRVISALMLGVACASTFVTKNSIDTLVADSVRQETITSALRNHLEGDMMHDAIRADMLATLLALETRNSESLNEVEADLKEHTGKFEALIAANQKLDLPADIKQALEAVVPLLNVYVNTARTLYADAKTDPFKAQSMREDFNKSFSSLEEKLGKVSDMIQEVSARTLGQSHHEAESIQNIFLVLSLASLFLIILMPVMTLQWLFKPLKGMMDIMHKLAEGDISVQVPNAGHDDEMGDIARTMQVFKENAQRIVAMAEERELQKQKTEQEKRQAIQTLANTFETNVKNVVDMVASAATEMEATSRSVSTIVDTNQDKLNALITQIDGTSKNVQTVSSATTQLSSAVNEINQQIVRSTSITASAVTDAGSADHTVQGLSDAAQKIGEVVEMINSIAAQINLLALNATIEAARAGDAGKGFAVVAAEVKSLATQTTKATEQIAQYITSIQGATTETVGVIKNIGNKIREINDISTTIAAAAEEQNVTTKAIASNAEQAAHNTEKVSHTASDVSTTSKETGESATQMMAATSELSRQAETLRSEVDKFLTGIRNG